MRVSNDVCTFESVIDVIYIAEVILLGLRVSTMFQTIRFNIKFNHLTSLTTPDKVFITILKRNEPGIFQQVIVFIEADKLKILEVRSWIQVTEFDLAALFAFIIWMIYVDSVFVWTCAASEDKD